MTPLTRVTRDGQDPTLLPVERAGAAQDAGMRPGEGDGRFLSRSAAFNPCDKGLGRLVLPRCQEDNLKDVGEGGLCAV